MPEIGLKDTYGSHSAHTHLFRSLVGFGMGSEICVRLQVEESAEGTIQ